MKKLFYSLSLALIGCLSINATPVKTANLNRNPFKLDPAHAQTNIEKAYRCDENGNRISNKKSVKKNSPLPTEASAYFGNWRWSSRSRLTGGLPTSGVLAISQSTENADSLKIKGLDQFADVYYGGLTGYFKDGRVYIPNQQVLNGEVTESPGYYSYFINTSARPATAAEIEEWEKENPGQDSTGLIHFLEEDEMPEGYDFFFALQVDEAGEEYISSTYYEDPNAELTAEILLKSFCNGNDVRYTMIKDDNGKDVFTIQGYYLSIFNVRGYLLEPFEFDPNEWEEAGIASYLDAWWTPIYGDMQGNLCVPDPYDVPLYRSTLNPYRYLLLDPYGPNTPWAQWNINADDSKEGYIVFDIAYTDESNIVLVEPFVYAFSQDDSETGDGSIINEIYNYNTEGLYYFVYGNDLGDIEPLMLDRNMDVSYFEKSENKIYLYNPIFDMVPEYTFASAFEYPEMPGGYIELPEGFENAVENIISDKSKAPVEYYNLQGVRVNNPAKGQIVIKRQGNNTSKFIAR